MRKLLFFLTLLIILHSAFYSGPSSGIYTLVVEENGEKFYAPEIWLNMNTEFVRIDLCRVGTAEAKQFHNKC